MIKFQLCSISVEYDFILLGITLNILVGVEKLAQLPLAQGNLTAENLNLNKSQLREISTWGNINSKI